MAWQSGLSPRESGEWTWGELLDWVEGTRERERRWFQQEALVAWGQMVLHGCQLAGEAPPALYEVFPFWTTDEVNEMKLAKYRKVMERQAATGGRSGGGN